METTEEMEQSIRTVLKDHARLPVDAAALADDQDLFQAGLTSHASVNVMLALEDHFDIEFPEQMLRKSTFESISSIQNALTGLLSVGVRE